MNPTTFFWTLFCKTYIFWNILPSRSFCDTLYIIATRVAKTKFGRSSCLSAREHRRDERKKSSRSYIDTLLLLERGRVAERTRTRRATCDSEILRTMIWELRKHTSRIHETNSLSVWRCALDIIQIMCVREMCSDSKSHRCSNSELPSWRCDVRPCLLSIYFFLQAFTYY